MIGVNVLDEIFIKNGLIVAFLTVGVMLFLADWMSKKIFNKRQIIVRRLFYAETFLENSQKYKTYK